MAKKNKRNIKALLAKRQQLEAASRNAVLTIPGAPLQKPTEPLPLPASPTSQQKALPAYGPSRELWRTIVSTAVIGLLLIGVIIANQQQHFLDAFGDTIYQGLQLDR